MIIDKGSRQRHPTPRHITDIAIDMKGPEALSQEVLKQTEELLSKQNLIFPITNTLFGTDAWVEGAKNYDRDVLGNIAQITRLRQRKKIIDLT